VALVKAFTRRVPLMAKRFSLPVAPVAPVAPQFHPAVVPPVAPVAPVPPPAALDATALAALVAQAVAAAMAQRPAPAPAVKPAPAVAPAPAPATKVAPVNPVTLPAGLTALPAAGFFPPVGVNVGRDAQGNLWALVRPVAPERRYTNAKGAAHAYRASGSFDPGDGGVMSVSWTVPVA
jgi:hypothetical protein